MFTAFADAIGLILVFDGILSLLRDWGSISFVFFHIPSWFPFAAAIPVVFGAAILLRIRVVILAAVAVAVVNGLQVQALEGAGRISGAVMPFSWLVAAALAPTLLPCRRARIPMIAGAAATLVLAHLLTFGFTDYRRPADAIVVFGAQAYRDYTPSLALYDRTMTGIRLYQEGYAPTLVLSGGGIEPEAMRRLARQQGVPDEAIVLDGRGVNTAATLRNLDGRYDRVLAVSHYYHNARIKMFAERLGLHCVTVPARMSRGLAREPYYVLRDCAAFVAYYLFVH